MQLLTVLLLQKCYVWELLSENTYNEQQNATPGAVSETPKFLYASYETPKAWTGLFSGIKEACRWCKSILRE